MKGKYLSKGEISKKRQRLQSINLVEVLRSMTYTEIAKAVGCGVTLVQTEAKLQFQEAGQKEHSMNVNGAWMNSKERININLYKQLNKEL